MNLMNPLCVMYGLCIICVLRCVCYVLCVVCVRVCVLSVSFLLGWRVFFLFLLFPFSSFLWCFWVHGMDLASWLLDGLGLEAIYPGMILCAISSILSL